MPWQIVLANQLSSDDDEEITSIQPFHFQSVFLCLNCNIKMAWVFFIKKSYLETQNTIKDLNAIR